MRSRFIKACFSRGQRDLWKTRDAKKEEARKNMLLYMDAHKGKRHYRDAPSTAQDAHPTDNKNQELAAKETEIRSVS